MEAKHAYQFFKWAVIKFAAAYKAIDQRAYEPMNNHNRADQTEAEYTYN